MEEGRRRGEERKEGERKGEEGQEDEEEVISVVTFTAAWNRLYHLKVKG